MLHPVVLHHVDGGLTVNGGERLFFCFGCIKWICPFSLEIQRVGHDGEECLIYVGRLHDFTDKVVGLVGSPAVDLIRHRLAVVEIGSCRLYAEHLAKP